MMETDRKLRLYFDTTIPNHLFARDRPDRMEVTWRLWEKCAAGEHDVCVSDVLFAELAKCPEPKLSRMLREIESLGIEQLEETDEVRALALEYVKSGALTEKHFNDCLHIAYAVVNECDIILSWNFDHTRDWTKGRVKGVNETKRYRGIGIMSPDDFLEGDRA
jgi:predicted nucleic acid-binding protein